MTKEEKVFTAIQEAAECLYSCRMQQTFHKYSLDQLKVLVLSALIKRNFSESDSKEAIRYFFPTI